MKKLALLLIAGSAHAGGLARPNGISARGVGMGGAFTAWADDASAVIFNPAALDTVDPQGDVGGELVVGPRSYTPVADDGTRGPAQQATVVSPAPSAGVVGRFWYDDAPSRFTLGAGIYNTFGGKVSFPKTGAPALDSTGDTATEIAAGTSLRISDRFSIGATFRLGIGLFALDATMNPFDAHLTASGIGVAMGLGALVRPTDTTRIGVSWRSPLRITTSGSGVVTFDTGPVDEQVRHDQVWPQQASLGGGWAVTPRVKLAAQIDWTEWSQVASLAVRFPASPGLDQVYPEDWNDSWTFRLGTEVAATPALVVRGGAYLDTAAVPDRTIERQYLDSNKLGVAAGVGYRVGDWRIDTALDFVTPHTRTVPNNTASTMAFPADRNKAPGDYRGTLVTLELAIARGF